VVAAGSASLRAATGVPLPESVRVASLREGAVHALIAVAHLLVLALMGLVFLIGELLSGATLYPWFLFPAVAAAVAVGWFGKKFFRSRVVLVAGLALGCAFLVVRFLELNPAKPFRAFYLELYEGQDVPSVLAALDRHFPAGGRFARPILQRRSTDEVLAFTLDPQDADYDSEFLHVFLKDGRLSRKSYSGD
jgi:hypothetical protein